MQHHHVGGRRVLPLQRRHAVLLVAPKVDKQAVQPQRGGDGVIRQPHRRGVHIRHLHQQRHAHDAAQRRLGPRLRIQPRRQAAGARRRQRLQQGQHAHVGAGGEGGRQEGGRHNVAAATAVPTAGPPGVTRAACQQPTAAATAAATTGETVPTATAAAAAATTRLLAHRAAAAAGAAGAAATAAAAVAADADTGTAAAMPAQRVRRHKRQHKGSQAQINELGVPCGRDEDVGGLDVAVDDAQAVQVPHRRRQLRRQDAHAALRQVAARVQQRLHGAALHVLLHHPDGVAGAVERHIKVYHKGMLPRRRQRLQLRLQAVATRRRRIQHLNRHRRPRRQVHGQVHRRKLPAAQRPQQLKVGKTERTAATAATTAAAAAGAVATQPEPHAARVRGAAAPRAVRVRL